MRYSIPKDLQVMGFAVALGIFALRPVLAQTVIYGLGSLSPGGSSYGFAINASGQVTGLSATGTNRFAGDIYAFIYTGIPGSGDSMSSLGTIAEGRSPGQPAGVVNYEGASINDSGQIVGNQFFNSEFIGARAFLYSGSPSTGGQMHDLFPGQFAGAAGINNAGQITGSNPAGDAYIYSGGTAIDLGSLGGVEGSSGSAINGLGQVTGYAATISNDLHAFLYTGIPGNGGNMADLGTLGGDQSFGQAINNLGEVAGYSKIDPTNENDHAFIYTGIPGSGGAMFDLGTLGGNNSLAEAINSEGDVVGSSDTANGSTDAFIYVGTSGAGGKMIDLNTYLTATDPAQAAQWTLTDATGINDSGLITGEGIYNNGSGSIEEAYILNASSLIAVPEPTSLAMLVLTVPTLLHRRKDRATA